jgi:hypothetical protein
VLKISDQSEAPIGSTPLSPRNDSQSPFGAIDVSERLLFLAICVSTPLG